MLTLIHLFSDFPHARKKMGGGGGAERKRRCFCKDTATRVTQLSLLLIVTVIAPQCRRGALSR